MCIGASLMLEKIAHSDLQSWAPDLYHRPLDYHLHHHHYVPFIITARTITNTVIILPSKIITNIFTSSSSPRWSPRLQAREKALGVGQRELRRQISSPHLLFYSLKYILHFEIWGWHNFILHVPEHFFITVIWNVFNTFISEWQGHNHLALWVGHVSTRHRLQTHLAIISICEPSVRGFVTNMRQEEHIQKMVSGQ